MGLLRLLGLRGGGGRADGWMVSFSRLEDGLWVGLIYVDRYCGQRVGNIASRKIGMGTRRGRAMRDVLDLLSSFFSIFSLFSFLQTWG